MTYKEQLAETASCAITPSDQQWLKGFGVDPSWSDDAGFTAEFNQIIESGSRHIEHGSNEADYLAIVNARKKFFDFVGVDQDVLRYFRKVAPTIIPLDTFIKTQRVMCTLGLDAAKVINTLPAAIGLAPESVQAKVANLTALGLDAAKVINTLPAAIGLAPESVQAKVANLTALGLDAAKVINTLPAAISYAPESVQAKVANLTALGLDAAKVINTLPAAISYAPESVQAKVANLTALGLDAAKVINTLPAAISYAPESVQAKVANLTALGLDAAKVINTLPAAIGLAPESVQAKVANLTALGLDAAKVINTLPAAISYAPESVQAKVAFLKRSAKLLQWEYDANELVETYPPILGFSTKKLRILRRIAATVLSQEARQLEPGKVKSALIVPLEMYLLSIPDTPSNGSNQLLKEARSVKLDAAERKQRAKARVATGELGRIGVMYLEYAK